MIGSPPDLRALFDETRDLFVAFGDRHRQDIVVALSENPNLTVREVSEQIGLSRPATSHHLRILREAGLLGERHEGRKTFYYPTLRPSFEQLRSLLSEVERQHGSLPHVAPAGQVADRASGIGDVLGPGGRSG